MATCNLTTRCELPFPDVDAVDWGTDFNAKIQLADDLIASLQDDNVFTQDVTVEGALLAEGTLTFGEYLYRYGDANTYIRARDDWLSLVGGGLTFVDFKEDTQDVIEFNPDQGDVDFIVNTLSLEALNIAGDTGIPYFKGTEFVLGGVTPTTGDWKYVKSGTSLLLQEYGGASWATKATFIP